MECSSEDRSPLPQPQPPHKKRDRNTVVEPSKKGSNTEKMEQTIHQMQQFMLQQGFLTETVDFDELCNYLSDRNNHKAKKGRNNNENSSTQKGNKSTGMGTNALPLGGEVGECTLSPSNTTVYKNAVEILDSCNISSSSDEFINTSNESAQPDNNKEGEINPSIVYTGPGRDDSRRRHRSPSRERSPSSGRSREPRGYWRDTDQYERRSATPDYQRGRPQGRDEGPTLEQQAEHLVMEAEKRKN